MSAERDTSSAATSPTDFQNRIGTERFVVEGELGKGGMGAVYQVFDRERQQRVALKTLHNTNARTLLRFKQEFRALADLVHPNLVALYELLSLNGTYCFTMELLRGAHFLHDLRERNSNFPNVSGPRLPSPESQTGLVSNETMTADSETLAQFMGNQEVSLESVIPLSNTGLSRVRKTLPLLAEALVALHETGHRHGDIKPSNVMVEPEGRVVVLDFGIIADLKGDRRAEDGFIGTPGYMAPEQVSLDRTPTAASDWYAVGVMLHEALTGLRPFPGGPRTVMQAKRERATPRQILSSLDGPTDLIALCRDLLDDNPDRRPSGREVLRRLRRGPQELRLQQHAQRDATITADIAADSDAPTSAPSPRESPQRLADETGDSATDLVGREEELRTLTEAWEEAKAGKGLGLLVFGPSGFGKSSLLDHFLARIVDDRDSVVLRGRCYEQESVPYKSIDSLVDSLAGYLASQPHDFASRVRPRDVSALVTVFPVLRRVQSFTESVDQAPGEVGESLELQRRAFAALFDVLQRIAEKSPLLLYIDDLQWGDVDSAPFLARLLQNTGTPMLVVAGYRSEEAKRSVLLRALLPAVKAQTRNVALGPLDQKKLKDLAERLLQAEGGPLVLAERISHEAKGSPYFVHELVRYAVEGGTHVDTMSLASVILARASSLSEPARRLLRVIAVAGRRLPLHIAQSAARLGVEENRAFAELRAGRFARSTGIRSDDTIEPYHDRVREAVAADLAADASRVVHLHLAQTLEQQAAQGPEHLYALATHFFHARPEGRAHDVVRLNREAGKIAAESFAFDQAYVYLRQAKESAAAADIDLGRNFERDFGEMSVRSGRADEAEAIFIEALEKTESTAERAALHLEISKIHNARLDSGAVVAAIQRAFEVQGMRLPRTRLWDVLVTLALWAKGLVMGRFRALLRSPSEAERKKLVADVTLHNEFAKASFFRLDPITMIQCSARVVPQIVRIGACRELISWLAGSGLIFAVLQMKSRSRAFNAEALRVAELIKDPVSQARVRLYKAMSLHFGGAPVAAEQAMEACLRDFDKWIEPADFFMGVADLSWNLLTRGHARQALQWHEKSFEKARLAATYGDIESYTAATRRCHAGPMLAMLGRAEEGTEIMDDFERYIEQTPDDPWRWGQLYSHKANFLVEVGDLGDGFEKVVAGFRNLKLSPRRAPIHLCHFYVALGRARVEQLRQASDEATKAQAQRSAEEALGLLARCRPHPTTQGHLLALQGLLEGTLERYDRASRYLEQAEQLAITTQNDAVLFDVAEERARIAAVRGQGSEVQAQLAKARAFAKDQGWKPRAARIDRALAAL